MLWVQWHNTKASCLKHMNNQCCHCCFHKNKSKQWVYFLFELFTFLLHQWCLWMIFVCNVTFYTGSILIELSFFIVNNYNIIDLFGVKNKIDWLCDMLFNIVMKPTYNKVSYSLLYIDFIVFWYFWMLKDIDAITWLSLTGEFEYLPEASF